MQVELDFVLVVWGGPLEVFFENTIGCPLSFSYDL